jgi:hypothetical protein
MTGPLAQAFQSVLGLSFYQDYNSGTVEDGRFYINENQDVNCTKPDVFQRSTFTLWYTKNLIKKKSK